MLIRYRRSTKETCIPYDIFKRLSHRRLCHELGLREAE